MTKYKKCPKGKCGEPISRKKRGTEGKQDEDKLWACLSGTENPCPATKEDECKCFVVAQHFVDDDDDTIKEEVAYPGLSDDEAAMLTEAVRKSKYPKATEQGKKAKDHWRISCQCLQLDKKGKPETE